MKRLRLAFITGLLVLVPLLATIDILRWLVKSLDKLVRTYLPTHLIPLDFVGLGLLLAVVVVLIVGVAAQNFAGMWFLNRVDRLLKRFPLVGGLYGGIKKFLETVLNPGSQNFSEAVLVEFPSAGIYSIGFKTGEPEDKVEKALGGRAKMINVFVPLTPNPTAGFYFFVPQKDVTPLDMSVQEAFKNIISMGVITSEEEIAELKLGKRKRKRKK